MSQGTKAVFWLLAILCYLVAALGASYKGKLDRTTFLSLGLGLFTVPFFWDAADAGW